MKKAFEERIFYGKRLKKDVTDESKDEERKMICAEIKLRKKTKDKMKERKTETEKSEHERQGYISLDYNPLETMKLKTCS